MGELKSPKYLTKLKETNSKFDYKVTNDGEYFVDYSNGLSQIDVVVEKLITLSNELNNVSEDVKTMLKSYVLDDSVNLNEFVIAVNGGMNSMASQMSKTIQEILTEAKTKRENSQRIDQEYIENQTEITSEIQDDSSTGTTPPSETPTIEGNDTPLAPLEQPSDSTQNSTAGEMLIAGGEDWLGTPYFYGGSSRSGIDCSAFTQAAAASIGITLPRTTGEQVNCGTHVEYNDLKPGDLIFTQGGNHVVIYAGLDADGDMQTLGASSVGGQVQYVKLKYQGDIYEIRRIC
jgi:cell wall-associated NlpC family hydrolase